MTLCLDICAPLLRNSLAKMGSTKETQVETFLALSLGTNMPQFEHWTNSLLPFPPLLLPRDLRFFGIGDQLLDERDRDGDVVY